MIDPIPKSGIHNTIIKNNKVKSEESQLVESFLFNHSYIG